MPDVAMKAYDGKEYKLSDFRADAEKKREGQVVVVYFQSEKCPAAIDPDVIKKTTAAWVDPKSDDAKALGLSALPAMWIVNVRVEDPKARVVKKVTLPKSGAALKTELAAVLKSWKKDEATK